MCGRFTLRTPAGVLVEQFRLESAPELAPRYNIAPTQDVAVVRNEHDTAQDDAARRELVLMHWGLVPSWSKDPKQGARMINARGETAAEKPSFRAAFKRRRCLVLADGYYEWQKTGGKHKQPFLIHRDDGAAFAFAGLWERWKGDDGPPLESCTIITTSSAESTREIHDRMPVILDEADYDLWLDVQFEDRERLQQLLIPWESDELVAEPVSTHVNNVRHDDPQCAEPQSP
ncbi:MAG: SOS response-associated peptidase [Pirellulaceae bacterium]